MNRIQTLTVVAGILLSLVFPLGLGGLIAQFQHIHLDNFIYAIFQRMGIYSAFFQLGVAGNIGLFFLMVKKDELIYLSRGWMVGTIVSAFWAVLIEMQNF